ncbi:hypothetical protein [Saccharopolyspora oryzae]|uniref:hypothetical protein n=1 Tax=Saccharopolyspora oryzae TaxID=2997343 RepID=UPI0038CDBADC
MARPEISVLLSHAKNLVHQELLDSDLPADPALLPGGAGRVRTGGAVEPVGRRPPRRPLPGHHAPRRMLADDVLAHGGLESWLLTHKTALTRVHTVYCDLSNAALNDFAVLSSVCKQSASPRTPAWPPGRGRPGAGLLVSARTEPH